MNVTCVSLDNTKATWETVQSHIKPYTKVKQIANDQSVGKILHHSNSHSFLWVFVASGVAWFCRWTMCAGRGPHSQLKPADVLAQSAVCKHWAFWWSNRNQQSVSSTPLRLALKGISFTFMDRMIHFNISLREREKLACADQKACPLYGTSCPPYCQQYRVEAQ